MNNSKGLAGVKKINDPTAAVLCAVITCVVCGGISYFLSGLYMSIGAFVTEVAIYSAAGIALILIGRERWPALLVQSLLIASIYFGHATKAALLGAPITATDLLESSKELFNIATWSLKFAVFTPIAVIIGLLLFNLKRPLVAVIGMVIIGAMVPTAAGYATQVASIVDWVYPSHFRSPEKNFIERGPTLFLVSDFLSVARLRVKSPPSELEVRRAFDVLEAAYDEKVAAAVPPRASGKQRNVHIIVLESFWDPKDIIGGKEAFDPFDPRLRHIWEASGRSVVMTPTFGSRTANSEFEALCGLPRLGMNIMFHAEMNKEMPCLPRLFLQAGYKTIATHPNGGNYWNRNVAYPLLGFQTFLTSAQFELNDMNGDFLSDESFFAQLYDKVDLKSEGPYFNYAVSLSGHYPFPLNERHPRFIELPDYADMVANYVSSVRYTSKAVMDYVDKIHARDPDALIVMFGDHLPSLDNKQAYQKAGIFVGSREKFKPDGHARYVSTPLMILDGKDNVLPVGRLVMYQLPQLIANLSGLKAYRHMLMSYASRWKVRDIAPFIIVDDHGQLRTCRNDLANEIDPACFDQVEWFEALSVLSRDLALGKQYGLKP